MRSDKYIPRSLGEWNSLCYWRSGEWQTVRERLDEIRYNPGNHKLFAALRAVDCRSCTCAILGQDPYPRLAHCSGLAFSLPQGYDGPRPPTLENILQELKDDLGLAVTPQTGDLSPWCEQGVLLWNVFPSCAPGKPGSHHWDEWKYLTQEIVERLNEKALTEGGPPPLVFLGRAAQWFSKFATKSELICTSHPSPLGVDKGFKGSRIFSRVNEALIRQEKQPIDWRF